MIISMSKILCITNRTLCRDDFAQRLGRIAAAHPAGIILREKDLSAPDYEALARKALAICQAQGTPCILHSFVDVAISLRAQAIHLPLPLLRTMTRQEKACFSVLGASCHCVQDAVEAEALGCTYVTAGHVFDTDCKKGLPGRGPDFLQAVCQAVAIPVYAIGGIAPQNMHLIRHAGAAGACVMSSIMKAPDVGAFLKELE